MSALGPKIYFSDVFNVSADKLDEYGAFNVSPIVDLPLFVDPFLLFTSDNPRYKQLHDEIIKYLQFLRDLSVRGVSGKGLLRDLYCFKEVHQNCLGFCLTGNRGAGLGLGFGKALNQNLHDLFQEFGDEKVTRGAHLEKLTLIREGVGRDNISDFTTNLIKGYLAEYTEAFALAHIDPEMCKRVKVPRVEFDYRTGTWKDKMFSLPWFDGDFVLLTPEDVLTKDDTWINKEDLRRDFPRLREAIANESLREQVDRYFRDVLPSRPTQKDLNAAVEKVLLRFPQIIDHFIKDKEDRGEEAVEKSRRLVAQTDFLFVENVRGLVKLVLQDSSFREAQGTTLDATKERVAYLKHVIENQDGYRFFYDRKGHPISREADLQLLFKLLWVGSECSVDAEVNNGRGPVDFKISRGSSDSTLVEFKLASNSQIERNLQNQVQIYEKANRTTQSFKVVLFFTEAEENKLKKLLRKLQLNEDAGLILIDARRDNKPSASKAG